MTSQIVHYNGHAIPISAGYLNATMLCQANGKEVSEWKSNTSTQEFLRELSETTGIPAVSLVEVREGRRGGTWIHRLAWYHLGQWCNAKCAVWVAKLLDANYSAEFTHAAYGEPIGDLFDSPSAERTSIAASQETASPEIQKLAHDDGELTFTDDETRMLLRQRLLQATRHAEELGGEVILEEIRQIRRTLDQGQLDRDDQRVQWPALNERLTRIEAQLNQLGELLRPAAARPDDPRARPTNGHHRERPHGCTCNPRPRGLFPNHRRNPNPCSVHQPRLFEDDQTRCVRCHTPIREGSRCPTCGTHAGI